MALFFPVQKCEYCSEHSCFTFFPKKIKLQMCKEIVWERMKQSSMFNVHPALSRSTPVYRWTNWTASLQESSPKWLVPTLETSQSIPSNSTCRFLLCRMAATCVKLLLFLVVSTDAMTNGNANIARAWNGYIGRGISTIFTLFWRWSWQFRLLRSFSLCEDLRLGLCFVSGYYTSTLFRSSNLKSLKIESLFLE